MKRKHLVLFVLLLSVMLLLSSCGVAREGVDVATTPPHGVWQMLVVWPLAKMLIWIHNLLVRLRLPYSWGFAIILFTLIVRLVTFPLTMVQMRGMQAQKTLQPKLQELQKRYGKDRAKLAQEQTKLYKEAGVNPLSGCLPLLVQMPILFGLYAALVVIGPNLVHASFFWIPDLAYPHYRTGLSWIPELYNSGQYGRLASYLLLPTLLILSQIFMRKYTMPTTTSSDGEDKGGLMGQMTTLMSLMFGFFTLQVPAGLTLYWVTSNVLQLGQQYAVARTQPDVIEEKPVAMVSNGNPVPGKLIRSVNDGKAGTGESATVQSAQPRSRHPRRRKKRK